MPRKGENIRKRKDGRWEARYEKCRDHNGRIQYGYLYGRTYEAVKKKKLAVLCQNNLQNSPGKCYVFRNLSEEWMLSMRYAVKLSTYACYETLLDTHILPEFGDMPLKYISSASVYALDIYEATFRFSSDKAYSEKKVLSSSIIICLPGIFICFCIPLLSNIIDFDGITLFAIAVSFALEAINLVIAQFLRGTNKMLQFAFSGIVASIGLLLANAYFLIILGWGLKGWILSFLISKIVCTIYLIVISNFKHMFSIQSVERAYVNQFLKFCIPLMPTATMWWIMNLSDRYMLAYFIGTAATGIYAVSNKIPSLLSVFETIFYQAWMTTAISTKDNSNRDEIYSNVFNNYLVILLIGVLGILLIGKPFVIILFENSYNNAYLYIPILIMGVVIHALNGNLGSLYSVFKNTKGALYSTAIGALSWKDVYLTYCSLLNKEPNFVSINLEQIKRYFPDFEQILVGDKGQDMIFDNTKVMDAIGGYSFQSDLVDGLKKSVNYYLKNPSMQQINYIWDGKCDYFLKKVYRIHLRPIIFSSERNTSKFAYWILSTTGLRFLYDRLRKLHSMLKK